MTLDVGLPWITTHDNCAEIIALYRSRRQFVFEIQYSAQTKRLGRELLIVPKGLRLPTEIGLVETNRPR